MASRSPEGPAPPPAAKPGGRPPGRGDDSRGGARGCGRDLREARGLRSAFAADSRRGRGHSAASTAGRAPGLAHVSGNSRRHLPARERAGRRGSRRQAGRRHRSPGPALGATPSLHTLARTLRPRMPRRDPGRTRGKPRPERRDPMVRGSLLRPLRVLLGRAWPGRLRARPARARWRHRRLAGSAPRKPARVAPHASAGLLVLPRGGAVPPRATGSLLTDPDRRGPAPTRMRSRVSSPRTEQSALRRATRRKEALIAILALAGIAAHLLLRHAVCAPEDVSLLPLHLTIVVGGAPLLFDIAARAIRRDLGSDLLAGIAIAVSALLREYLAGAFVVLMLASGQALEGYAVGRASSVLHALARRVPSVAHRRRGDGLHDVRLDEIAAGNLLVVLPHEICPVDGLVVEGHGVMDESYLTGEPFRISKAPGANVLSGAINGETALTIRAVRKAVDSRYARIMQVMQETEQRRPRLRRLADRLGAYYTPVALLLAAAAGIAAGDPRRFLAVMVVATPCPLLIAIPVAIIASVSLAARRSIVVKDPAVLEEIDTCRTIVLDKTGTLTYGEPTLSWARNSFGCFGVAAWVACRRSTRSTGWRSGRRALGWHGDWSLPRWRTALGLPTVHPRRAHDRDRNPSDGSASELRWSSLERRVHSGRDPPRLRPLGPLARLRSRARPRALSGAALRRPPHALSRRRGAPV